MRILTGVEGLDEGLCRVIHTGNLEGRDLEFFFLDPLLHAFHMKFAPFLPKAGIREPESADCKSFQNSIVQEHADDRVQDGLFGDRAVEHDPAVSSH